ncbi:DUF429 domain-containing protein [Methanosarcina sp. KYL-1]|uniref:DUF429 domain-containing protein n=1 Tax=Methanosarcina sp. KYL-1 TaxID=2602068 RepID=UPI002101BDE8|nr:DUF429 domain-containing protein [Methanosarcina sp. KYL-1]MCQ1535695.1 DUF429 domain-containing protein [Methanosarcina sp. KYL-1]
MNQKVFVGVDGCSAGWFAVFLTEQAGKNFDCRICDSEICDSEICDSEICDDGNCDGKIFEGENCGWELGVFPRFSALCDFLKDKYEDYEPLVLIDIPIGLKAGGTGERLSDLGARKVLAARKSSIFPVPCREAVYTETYEKACEVNERLTGKRISKQAWNILPKIRDVYGFLLENEEFRPLVWEVGPEICFQAFAGRPMKYSKKQEEGFIERKEVLNKILKTACSPVNGLPGERLHVNGLPAEGMHMMHMNDMPAVKLPVNDRILDDTPVDRFTDVALSRYRRKDLAKDDILDALAAALTAKMGALYGFEYVPEEPDTDAEGLRIQVVYCDYFPKVTGISGRKR